MRQRARLHPARMSVAEHWWEAVSGGRFFTRWTVITSGVVAVAIMSPYIGRDGFLEIFAAMLTSLLAWVLLVVAVLPLAAAEQKLRSRAARGAVVLGALLMASIARPFLNDLLASVMFGEASTGEWAQRIATNALIWFTVLPLVAAAGTWYSDAKRSAERLAAALAVFDDLHRRISRYGHDNARLLTTSVAQLRSQRDALLAGQIDFDAVRAFADDVRAASHRLDERLRTPLDHRAGYALPYSPARRTRGALLTHLSRPPAALVAATYLLASAPFMYVVGGWPLALYALGLLAVLALGADLATRALSRGRTPTVSGVIIVACWSVVGIAMTVAGSLLTSVEGVVHAVPLLAIPGLAVVLAFARHALERARHDGRKLTELLGTTSSIVTAQTAGAREPLWRAVDLLHDRVQGRCVIFAARVDERPPTPDEVSDFRAATDAAFVEILAGSPAEAPVEDDLDGLLTIWSGVLDVRAEIDPLAVAALQSRAVAASVVSAVREGLVNAVKHSAARVVHLTVAIAGDRSPLMVRISSHGILPAAAATGIGLASFGDRARLYQDGDQVVLEVTVPVGVQSDARGSS